VRLLADENFPGAVVAALRTDGHDILWIRTELPGATDETVLHLAQTEGRVLVTLDKDFGELAFRSRLPSGCGVILFRLTPSSPDFIVRTVLAALSMPTEWHGHFAVIEENRIRITPLPK